MNCPGSVPRPTKSLSFILLLWRRNWERKPGCGFTLSSVWNGSEIVLYYHWESTQLEIWYLPRTLDRGQNLHGSLEVRGFLLSFAGETKTHDTLSFQYEINIMTHAHLGDWYMIFNIHCTVRRWYSRFLGRRLHNICAVNRLHGHTDPYTRATTTCKRRNVLTNFLFSVGRDKLRPRARLPSVCAGSQWSTSARWGCSFRLEAAWRHRSKWLQTAITIWPSGQRKSLFSYSVKLWYNFV